MVTLGQLSQLEQAKTAEPPENEGAVSQVEKQRRMVIYTLNGTLVAGLALALVYLGGRVIEMRATAKMSAPKPQASVVTHAALPQTPTPTPTKPAITSKHIAIPPVAPVTVQTPLKRYEGTMIDPKPGERYVQIGAYGPTFTRAVVEQLKGLGFQPLVSQGPTDDVYRVLVGPLNDGAALQSALTQAEQAGITGALVRKF